MRYGTILHRTDMGPGAFIPADITLEWRVRLYTHDGTIFLTRWARSVSEANEAVTAWTEAM